MGHKRVGFGYRLLSNVVDLVVLVVLMMCFNVLVYILHLLRFRMGFVPSRLIAYLSFIMFFLFPPLMIGLSELLFAVSPGKWLMGLRIEPHEKTRRAIYRRLSRTAIKYGCYLILFLGAFLAVWIDLAGHLSEANEVMQFFLVIPVPLYGVFSLISFLCCLRESGLALHDQFSGTAVCSRSAGKENVADLFG